MRWIAALLFIIPSLAYAAPSIKAVRLDNPPVIDGALGDIAWNSAARIDDFYQWKPSEGSSATEKTTAWVGYDDKYLYVAFQAWDSDPNNIYAHLTPREDMDMQDKVWISISPFNDRRTGYDFQSNALGVQLDDFFTAAGTDNTFDTVWKSAARRTPSGYIVEMAIPFKSLRFHRKNVQDWGIQFHRYIARKDEHISWPAVYVNRGNPIYQMGTLEGLKEISPGKNIEVIPEVTGSKSPGTKWEDHEGINFKYNPAPDDSLDATYKPDYSQLELDPVRVLTNIRFPVFIPEKRPFFMERADMFSTPIQVVNTRTIVSPLWGLKGTGKFSDANVGALFSGDSAPSPQHAYFSIARAKLDVGKDNTLGVIGTDREQGNVINRVAGVDGTAHFRDIYTAGFQALESHTLNPTGPLDGKAYWGTMTRVTRTMETFLYYQDISPSFEADAGFIPRTDIRSMSGTWNYYWFPEQPQMTRWGPTTGYTRIYNHEGQLTDESGTVGLYLDAPKWGATFLGTPQALERFSGTNFRKTSYAIDFGGTPNKYITGGGYLSLGDAIHYSAPVELGQSRYMNLNFTVIPYFQNVKLETSGLESVLKERPTGITLSEQDTLRETLRIQMTREFSFRVIGDYTRILATPPPNSKTLTTSALAVYLINPGTAAYLGFDVTRQYLGGGPWTTIDQTIFTKLTYLFRY